MKLIKTEEAAGHVLCHDLTQIIKDEKKDAVFRKGHVVKEEDIPVLLGMGKEYLYLWEKQEGMLHEEEGARILLELCINEHMVSTEPKEGKIDILADCDGLLKVDAAKLRRINGLGEMMIACRHGNFPVKKGDKLVGTRIIPLLIKAEKMEQAKALCPGEPIFKILPFLPKKIGIVITGNELLKGRIEDHFTEVLLKKLREYDTLVIARELTGDDSEHITKTIQIMIDEKGADLVLCTGGMSVDPDDRTPLAIKNTGAVLISYGAPVLPGAMFLLSYYKERYPVVGLPGCVMYAGRTIFDLILPRLLAEDKVTAKELAELGEGGLCLNCKDCHFPNCGFGK